MDIEDFERNGYLIIKNVLSPEKIGFYSKIADEIHSAHAKTKDHRLLVRSIFNYSSSFLDLVDHPKILPKVCEILSSNISLYYTHLIVTPPALRKDPNFTFDYKKTVGWHQDGQYVNVDIKSSNRPRLSMKAGFYLTDCNKPGMGNMIVLPGDFDDSYPTEERLKRAIPVCADKGDVVIFDRRLWHTADTNFSETTRKVAFFGYAYRWMEALDDLRVYEKLRKKSNNPIISQLLRHKNRDQSFHNPYKDGDCPLKNTL